MKDTRESRDVYLYSTVCVFSVDVDAGDSLVHDCIRAAVRLSYFL